jgi:hypothetical protein
MNDFSKFLSDMGQCPDGFSIERKDNGLGYSKENCYWASRTQQNRNKRSNVKITIGSETMCISEWAERSGIKRETISARLRRGWSPLSAIITQV